MQQTLGRAHRRNGTHKEGRESIKKLVFLLAASVALGACATGTTPYPPCCYAGPVTTTRLAALELVTSDGQRVGFAEVFPGFEPDTGLFKPLLPFRELRREDVIYRTVEPLLALYDANGNGLLEEPEILVMYAREAALAMGTSVKYFWASAPVWAISAPTADVGGLVHWVEARRGQMSEDGQALFRDLERLGQDLRLRGSEGPDDTEGVYVP